MGDILDELNGLIADGIPHLSGDETGHCGVCHLRMPCDVSVAAVIAQDAVHVIDDLRTELAALRQRIANHTCDDYWAGGDTI